MQLIVGNGMFSFHSWNAPSHMYVHYSSQGKKNYLGHTSNAFLNVVLPSTHTHTCTYTTHMLTRTHTQSQTTSMYKHIHTHTHHSSQEWGTLLSALVCRIPLWPSDRAVLLHPPRCGQFLALPRHSHVVQWKAAPLHYHSM